MNKKVSELSELSEAPANNDIFIINDVSDDTGSSAGTTKKITYQNLTSGVGGSSGSSPAYTPISATSETVSSVVTNVASIPLNGSSDKFKITENNDDGKKWRLNLTGGTQGEYYTFRVAWHNVAPRGGGTSYDLYDNAVYTNQSMFEIGWNGDYTKPQIILEKAGQEFRPLNWSGPELDSTRIHVTNQPYAMKLKCNLNNASGATVTTDSNGKKWLTNSGNYSSNDAGWLWSLWINDYQLNADAATPAGFIMRYIYAYDDGGGLEQDVSSLQFTTPPAPVIKYWDENYNFATIDVASDLTNLVESSFNNDTVVTEATWWDVDMISVVMENHGSNQNIGSSTSHEQSRRRTNNI